MSTHEERVLADLKGRLNTLATANAEHEQTLGKQGVGVQPIVAISYKIMLLANAVLPEHELIELEITYQEWLRDQLDEADAALTRAKLTAGIPNMATGAQSIALAEQIANLPKKE